MAIIQFPKNEKSCCGGGAGPITLTLPIAARPLSRIRFDPIAMQDRAVSPEEALNWVDEHLQNGVEVAAVDIAGPGDPLGEIDCTVETLRLIRQQHPDIVLSLTTLGIHADKYAKILGEIGVRHVTLLVDAVDLEVANKLYAWIRPDRKTIPLDQATAILMAAQRNAVEAFQQAGCTITVRSTVYPGFNDDHVEDIAEVMAGYGAESMTLVPYQPAESEGEAFLVQPDREQMQRLMKGTAAHLATTLAPKKESLIDCLNLGPLAVQKTLLPKPTCTRPNVAVVSSNGMEIDLHLGQAYQVLIYGPRDDGLPCLLATRALPEPGGGSFRWQELAESLSDCFALLTASAGESPRRLLHKAGIATLITDSEIAHTVDVLYGGGKKSTRGRKETTSRFLFLKSENHTIELTKKEK